MIKIQHLETDVTLACQLSCVACNHHVPLHRVRKGGPPSADVRQVEKDLGHLATMLHADRWGALGGEPTLHHALVDILKVARDSGVADKTEVWTNGLTLPKMKPEFWRSFDVLVLSIYPGKHTDQSLRWIVDKCEAEGVELSPRDERQFPNFKALFEATPMTDPIMIRAKYAGCFFRHFSRVANDGYFFTCCCAPHMPELVQGRPFGSDGIAIEGLTEAGLSKYLGRPEPLGACSNCAGRDTAVPVRWHEQKDPAAWMRESAGLS